MADQIGWRQTYAVMAVLSALALLAVWLALPAGLQGARIDLSAWKKVLGSPVLMLVLLVTLLSMAGQFTLFTYLSPILSEAYGAGPGMVSAVFLVVGGMGVLGNIVAGRLSQHFGLAAVIGTALALIAAGMGLIAAGWGLLAAFILGGSLWGLGSFASNSLQQSRLVGLAPPLASATVALNTTGVYLGQSLGAQTGGWLIAAGPTPAMALTGAGFALAAVGISAMAERMNRW
jgi:predicted MFS family arabinose efflux permease